MEITGLSVQGGYEYSFDVSKEWKLQGSKFNIDLNTDIDADKMFWSKFRIFYSASSGTVKYGKEKLAELDGFEIGFGLLAGARVYQDEGFSIRAGVGFGMGFGMMSVNPTDHGKEKWDPKCPTFSEIVEDFSGLTCHLKGLDGSYTSKKFLAEVGIEMGPLTLTPSFEYSFNSKKKGQIITNLMKVGISAGVQF